MNFLSTTIRKTGASWEVGVVRLLLGVLFLMTGLMKLFVPMLREAFSGQLTLAGIPLHDLNMWVVPLAEVAIGVLLLLGAFARLAALAAIGTMIVATYVHLVVDDPTVFPLQSTAPIAPILVLLLSGLILWRGAGSWSLDRRSTGAASAG